MFDSVSNIPDDENFILPADPVFQTAGTADQYISQDKMINSEMELIGEEKELVYY